MVHPTADMKLPDGDLPEAFWIYQNTWAEMKSVEPALDAAFSAVGIRRRDPPMSFQPRVPLPADPLPPPAAAAAAADKGTKSDAQKQHRSKKLGKQQPSGGKSGGKDSVNKAEVQQPKHEQQPTQEPAPEEWTGIMVR